MAFQEFADHGFESGVRTLFRRCKECEAQKPCPTCPDGQVCRQTQRSCMHCAQRSCVDAASAGITIQQPASSGGGTNIGAVVGGVIGGLVFMIAVIWLVWRFVIKPRQQQWGVDSDQTYEPYSEMESSGAYEPSPQQRDSQFTRRSVASTTYTRGSNVIQIAFIPGITDRSGEDDAMVPPVPPVPIRTATSTPQSPQSPYTDNAEDHYFMPGDLRDSHYSGFTDDAASTFNRRSMASSIAPSLLRQSVATTSNYTNTVENPAPAQTAQRGRPQVVSVKSSVPNSRSPSTPSVPRVDYEKYGQPQPIKPASATPLLADTASVTSFKTAGDMSPTAANNTASSSIPAIKVDNASLSSRQQTPPQLIKSENNKPRTDLKSAIEEATRQASRQPVHGGLGSVRRDPSPFSDENRLPDEE